MVATLKLKGCPRCGGDLITAESDGESVLQCLQCSREWERRPVPGAPTGRRSASAREIPPARPGRPRKQQIA